MLFICLYVEDLLVTGSYLSDIEELKTIMKSEFEMTVLGKLTYFLGMDSKGNGDASNQVHKRHFEEIQHENVQFIKQAYMLN